jgi:hypothetical protein
MHPDTLYLLAKQALRPPPLTPFGVSIVKVEYKGKTHLLDTALLADKGLMSLGVFCALQGVTKSESPDAFAKLQKEYNTVHKPAFWAWLNSAVDSVPRDSLYLLAKQALRRG